MALHFRELLMAVLMVTSVACRSLGEGYEEESFAPAAPAIYRWSVLAFLFLKDRLRDS
jgi:hypothetical protein